MNKQEFKSAYNKIALSEEFKTQAKAKLVEQFGKAEEKYPSDNVIEEHQATEIKLTPKRRNPWKAVAGIGTAAAVVGLGIWGGSIWLDRTQNPLDDQPTTEVSETVETNESVDIPSDMELHRITFPAYYYDLDSKLYNPAMDMYPFGLTIALPQEWDIVVPNGDDAMGVSMVFIMDGEECIGAIDCGIYSKFDDVEFGDPSYNQTILTNIMARKEKPMEFYDDFTTAEKVTGEWSMQPFGIRAVTDDVIVRSDDSMAVATCTMYRNYGGMENADVLHYGSGILSYTAYPYEYAYACFADVLDEKLLNDIVSSIELTTTALEQQSVTFPAYYDNETEYNKDIFSAVPFELDITLPEKWEIVVPEKEQRSGFSAVDIVADGEIVGSIDFNIYDKYEGMEYGEPNYHQMVFNQLFLGSVINWNADYTEVKTDGWLKSATCSIYHNDSADGRNDDVEYTSGILAYRDDMQVYVNISFTSELDPKLHTMIAESVSITESTAGLAYRLAKIMIEQESDLRYNTETDLCMDVVEFPCGTYVAVEFPNDSGDSTISTYEIRNGRINGRLSFYPIIMYAFEDSFIYKEYTVLPNGRHQERYIHYVPDADSTYDTFEIIAEFEYSLPPDDEWQIAYDIIGNMGDGDVSLTPDEMIECEIKITEDCTHISTFNLGRIQHTECNAQDLATIIRQSLYAMESLPEEEPVPMPPNLYLDAEGAERPLLMCSYTWGEGLDEFHHDGWTIEDAVQMLKNPIYPASWFDDARLIVPEGGVITSVNLHTDELHYTELQFTADGAIILPEAPVGEHIRVTVDYPEGACEYLMTVDFPETSEPPAVTLNGKELTIGSYIWNGELSGDHPRNADIWQMFLSGELLTVTDESTIQLTMPEGARLLDAICFGEDMESEMMLGCEENGEVRLPTASTKNEGVIRLGVEYPDGSVSYWVGFTNTVSDTRLSESIAAVASYGTEFELRQSKSGWDDPSLFTLSESEYIELALPENAKITSARATDLEDGDHELIFTEDGKVWMPYFDRMIISITVATDQEEAEYQFIHRSCDAPVLAVYSEENDVDFAAFCSYWGWAYLVYEANEEDFGYEQALAMHNSDGFYDLCDVGEIKLDLPAYTTNVHVEYYDENGNAHEIKPTEHGTYTMPDMTSPAMIKVTLKCMGTCEYWFSHYWSTCGTEELELEDLENPPDVQIIAGENTVTPATASCYWIYGDEELYADAMWIIDAENEGKVPHISAAELDGIMVEIPHAGQLISAFIESEDAQQELEITSKGWIFLPDEPIGYLVRIKVIYYTQGNCEYYFALDDYYTPQA